MWPGRRQELNLRMGRADERVLTVTAELEI